MKRSHKFAAKMLIGLIAIGILKNSTATIEAKASQFLTDIIVFGMDNETDSLFGEDFKESIDVENLTEDILTSVTATNVDDACKEPTVVPEPVAEPEPPEEEEDIEEELTEEEIEEINEEVAKRKNNPETEDFEIIDEGNFFVIIKDFVEVDTWNDPEYVDPALLKASVSVNPGAYSDDREFENDMYSAVYADKFGQVSIPEFTYKQDEAYNAYKHARDLSPKEISSDYSYLDVITTCDGSCTESDKLYFQYAVSLVPGNLLNRMAQDGWTINLVGDIITDTPEGWTTNGECRYEEKAIYVDKDSNVRENVLHEVGHALMEYYNGRKEAVDRGIYRYDCDGLHNVYSHFKPTNNQYIYYNYAEGLAENFAEYICYPRELQQQSPALFDAYEAALANI